MGIGEHTSVTVMGASVPIVNRRAVNPVIPHPGMLRRPGYTVYPPPDVKLPPFSTKGDSVETVDDVWFADESAYNEAIPEPQSLGKYRDLRNNLVRLAKFHARKRQYLSTQMALLDAADLIDKEFIYAR